MALKKIPGIVLLGPLLLLAAGGAHAQADISAYGVADWSYGRFEPSGLYREHRFNSNSMTASFVGVQAKYGLEDRWKPGITLETFVRFQDFQAGRSQDDPHLSRNAFVSLGSDYGELRVGRQQTPLFETTARFNALGNSLAFSPAMRHLFGSGNLESIQGDFYWNRALGYQAPRVEDTLLEDIRARVMVAQGPSSARGNYSSASVIYAKGLFSAAFAAQRVNVNDGIRDATIENTWQLGASYSFDFGKVFGQYTQISDRGLVVRSKMATVGTVIPLGPGDILAQIGYTTAKGPAVDRRHTTTSLAYIYAYNSEIDIYVAAMDDRVKGQTRGASIAAGVRWKFEI